MTTHTTSAGKVIPIADMNDYHLHNAIKKLASSPIGTNPDEEAKRVAKLAELRAEQAKRGGPPKDAK